jgi:endo-1,4-beta-D-glucanase Y/4-amino-4-deoxy-L-arabinose transferase-like glycosyltransferase
MSSRIDKFIHGHKFELLMLVVALIIAALAHGTNMFNFPYYENDEGVYVSQAWSLLAQGKLAPYTYWYDHAPLGWMLIAAWSTLTGGFFTFGPSINSGRVLMLVLHIASCVLVYAITRSLAKSKIAGIASILIFSLTPLGIYFQRRVLLDNIMVFWLLLSVTAILYYKNHLTRILLSALALGIAILTKENAIFFVPILLYWVYYSTYKRHKSFAITQWILIVGGTVSLYFIYALIKGEFFATGTFLGGTNEHVSLLETLKYQNGRDGGGIINPDTSLFWKQMRIWLNDDYTIIYIGSIATIINTFLGLRNHAARFASLLCLSFIAFLVRGGVVLEFYIVPLIPLFSINIGYLLGITAKIIKTKLSNDTVGNIAATAVLSALVLNFLSLSTNMRDGLNIYASNQTKPQIEATNWIKNNLDAEDFIIIDNYGYLDLRQNDSKKFDNADWYWKVDTDKDVLDLKLKNNPNNVDYLAVTPQMEYDITNSGLNLVGKALANSRPLHRFWNDGWGVTIWGTLYPDRILKSTWTSNSKRFTKSGKIEDPTPPGYVSAELQADFMLFSVLMNDKDNFSKIYKWTTSNLQKNNKLFTSVWKDKTIRNDSATVADTEIALSLIFAYKKWNNPEHINAAKEIIQAIRKNEIVSANNLSIVLAGDNSSRPEEFIISPKSLNPAAYKIFSQVDPEFNWIKVADDSYEILNLCTHLSLDKQLGKLPPEWCALNKSTNTFTYASFQPSKQTEYSINSLKVPLNIMIDYRLFNDARAESYLTSLRTFVNDWTERRQIAAVYKHDGTVAEDYETVRSYAAALPVFMVTDPKVAEEVFQEKIAKKFYETNELSYWEDPENMSTQVITWFSTSLYGNKWTGL